MSFFGFCGDDNKEEPHLPLFSPEQKLRETIASGSARPIGIALAAFDPKALKKLVLEDVSIWRALGSRIARAKIEEIPSFGHVIQNDLKGLAALPNRDRETIISQTVAFMVHYRTPEPVRYAIFDMFREQGLNPTAEDVAASVRQVSGRG